MSMQIGVERRNILGSELQQIRKSAGNNLIINAIRELCLKKATSAIGNTHFGLAGAHSNYFVLWKIRLSPEKQIGAAATRSSGTDELETFYILV